MSIDRDDVGKSAQTASDAGAFVDKAARVAKPANSTLGRVGAAASAVRLGARLLPAGWRLFKRYPLVSTLAVTGLIWGVYLTRPRRLSARM
ncbi:MAG: hypothetical protein JWN85_5174 [Gammaproteobacteria bacterium]|nr:hypothetical protein [Gammaproteobacteria bacterium]